MTWAAWGSGVFKNPESMWSSEEAERRSGNNITGFKDKTVDELIEKQKSIFDITQRNDIYRQIDAIIYNQHPYALLWNIDYTRLLYWNKFGTPETVLSKFGDESSAYWYWWIDPDSQADLADAVSTGLPLPPRPPSVDFDDIFGH
jgi:microcin C transport system substrate-binding protein